MRAALASAVVVLLAATACSGSDQDSAESAPATVTELKHGAVGVTGVDGTPWFAQPKPGAVLPGLDGTPVKVGKAPLRLVDTPAGVWVSVIKDGTLVRLDPTNHYTEKTVRLTPEDSRPEGLAWDGKHLWVADEENGRVVELDPDGAVVRSYRTGAGPRVVASGPSGIWVTNYVDATVSRIRDGKVRSAFLPGCFGPQGVAEADGHVWIACTTTDRVLVLDRKTLEVVTDLPEVPGADAVLTYGRYVYVVGQFGPTVYVVEASTGLIADRIRLDDIPTTDENVGAAVVGGNLVVTQPDEKLVYTLPAP